LTYYRATGGQDLSAVERLSSNVEQGLHQEIVQHTLGDVVSGDRTPLIAAVEDRAKPGADSLGVEIVDVRLSSVSLPEKMADAWYGRIRAEQASIAADLRARGAETAEKTRAAADQQVQSVLSDAYRDAERARGEGDAKASEIYARAYGQDPEFFRFYRSINAYRDAFKDSHDVLVLQPDSEFFRYFGGAGAASGKR